MGGKGGVCGQGGNRTAGIRAVGIGAVGIRKGTREAVGGRNGGEMAAGAGTGCRREAGGGSGVGGSGAGGAGTCGAGINPAAASPAGSGPAVASPSVAGPAWIGQAWADLALASPAGTNPVGSGSVGSGSGGVGPVAASRARTGQAGDGQGGNGPLGSLRSRAAGVSSAIAGALSDGGPIDGGPGREKKVGSGPTGGSRTGAAGVSPACTEAPHDGRSARDKRGGSGPTGGSCSWATGVSPACAEAPRDGRSARGKSAAKRRRQRAGAGGSLYAEVTRRIVADLRQGIVPWVCPWTRQAVVCLPVNAVTARRYSGINILLLWAAAAEKGYPVQRWLTFRQAIALGGTVRRGETGTTVCYADRFVPSAEAARAAETGDEAHAVAFLKRFTLFNVDQCAGLPPPPDAPDRSAGDVPAAEALVWATGADVRIGGSEAFYAPGGDYVRLPPPSAFHEPVNFYRTCFHELGHWTGHAKRLARDQSGRFGSLAYAREELVAELAAAFLCAELAIRPTVRHADYLGHWLTLLETDERAIFRAASAASKAADLILSCRAGSDDGAVDTTPA